MAFGSRRFTDNSTGDTTILASGIEFTGNFSGSGNVFVSSKISCDCNITGTITVAEEGEWEGNVHTTDIVIAGTINGNVTCDGNAELAPSARVTGNITAKRVAIAEGAVIDGHVQTASNDDVIRFTERRAAQVKVTPASVTDTEE